MKDAFYQPSDRRQQFRLAIHQHSRLSLTLDGAEPDSEAIGGVTLTDISHDGLMAADAGHLVPGAQIMLEIPLVGWREAKVMWIAENRAGCRFLQPLSLEELRLAAISNERLADECPGLFTQLAHIAADASATPAPELPPGPADPRKGQWRNAMAVLVSLCLGSFALISWWVS